MYVLLLLQAATGLLAVIALLLVMGSPVYAVGTVARAAALVVLGAKIVRGRRWALVTTVVLEWLGLLGVWVGVLLGLLPGIDPVNPSRRCWPGSRRSTPPRSSPRCSCWRG